MEEGEYIKLYVVCVECAEPLHRLMVFNQPITADGKVRTSRVRWPKWNLQIFKSSHLQICLLSFVRVYPEINRFYNMKKIRVVVNSILQRLLTDAI